MDPASPDAEAATTQCSDYEHFLTQSPNQPLWEGPKPVASSQEREPISLVVYSQQTHTDSSTESPATNSQGDAERSFSTLLHTQTDGGDVDDQGVSASSCGGTAGVRKGGRRRNNGGEREGSYVEGYGSEGDGSEWREKEGVVGADHHLQQQQLLRARAAGRGLGRGLSRQVGPPPLSRRPSSTNVPPAMPGAAEVLKAGQGTKIIVDARKPVFSQDHFPPLNAALNRSPTKNCPARVSSPVGDGKCPLPHAALPLNKRMAHPHGDEQPPPDYDEVGSGGSSTPRPSLAKGSVWERRKHHHQNQYQHQHNQRRQEQQAPQGVQAFPRRSALDPVSPTHKSDQGATDTADASAHERPPPSGGEPQAAPDLERLLINLAHPSRPTSAAQSEMTTCSHSSHATRHTPASTTTSSDKHNNRRHPGDSADPYASQSSTPMSRSSGRDGSPAAGGTGTFRHPRANGNGIVVNGWPPGSVSSSDWTAGARGSLRRGPSPAPSASAAVNGHGADGSGLEWRTRQPDEGPTARWDIPPPRGRGGRRPPSMHRGGSGGAYAPYRYPRPRPPPYQSLAHTHIPDQPLRQEWRPTSSKAAQQEENGGGPDGVGGGDGESVSAPCTPRAGPRGAGRDGHHGGGRGHGCAPPEPKPISYWYREQPVGSLAHCGVFQHLSAEVDQFVASVDHHIKTKEGARREQMLCVLRALILAFFEENRKKYRRAQADQPIGVEVFGSYSTNLFLPTSDIDLAIVNVELPAADPHPLAYDFTQELLLSIAEWIDPRSAHNERDHPELHEWISGVQFIPAKTPLLTVRTTTSVEGHTTQIDISVVTGKHHGIQTAKLVQRYCEGLPTLRPLVLVLKHLLSQRGMNKPFEGGLSSYALTLMAIAFLQTPQLYNNAHTDVGQQLCSLCAFYGGVAVPSGAHLLVPKHINGLGQIVPVTFFDYNLLGISVRPPHEQQQQQQGQHHERPPALFSLVPFNGPLDGSRLCVEDPMDRTNNVGRTAFNISEIQRTFRLAYGVFSTPCVCCVGASPPRQCSNLLRRLFLY